MVKYRHLTVDKIHNGSIMNEVTLPLLREYFLSHYNETDGRIRITAMSATINLHEYIKYFQQGMKLFRTAVEKIGINPDDVSCLVAKGSGCKKLHQAHHTYSIRMAVIHLEHRMKRYTSASCTNTIIKAWKSLTGYDTFKEAYNNPDETRRLTQDGVIEYDRQDYGEVDYSDRKAEMRDLGPGYDSTLKTNLHPKVAEAKLTLLLSGVIGRLVAAGR